MEEVVLQSCSSPNALDLTKIKEKKGVKDQEISEIKNNVT